MLSGLVLIICLNIMQRVFWRGVLEELLWLISGSTNAKVKAFSFIFSESMCFFLFIMQLQIRADRRCQNLLCFGIIFACCPFFLSF